jgi:cyanophycin synthetase
MAGAKRLREVDEVRGEFVAIDTALAALQPGDLCLILVDQVEEALAYIARRIDEDGRPPSAGRPRVAQAGGRRRAAR